MKPPPISERLLRLVMPSEDRDPVLGDAAEEFERRVERSGEQVARRWYRRQVRRSVIPALRGRFLGWLASERSELGGGEVVSMGISDMRLAVRALLARPGFSFVLVFTLALGIGATTALFGVYKTVFLEPLDLPDADEIMVVMQRGNFGCCGPASGPDYVDWAERQRTFDDMAMLIPGFMTLTGLDQAERVYATHVTANAFDFLGVSPALGRPLIEEDQEADQVVVLAHGSWHRLFAGRADAVGETLEVDGVTLTVVGVMPEGFDVPSPWGAVRAHELYRPVSNESFDTPRGNHGYPVVARLSDGTSIEEAQADMDRIMRELAVEYPDTNEDRGAVVFSAHDYRYGDVGRQFGILLAAAALVLLVACGNVAALLLARAAGRESELSVRAALGASRLAIVRLLFAESLVLSLLAGAAGIGFAFFAVEQLRLLLPATVPRIDAIAVDVVVLVFALGASLLTAFVFGTLPAFLASRTDLATGVREGGYSTLAPRKERLRDAFIVLQIATGLVLVNGAALLVQSYAAVSGQEHGFETEAVLTLALGADGPEYDGPGATARFFDQVIERVGDVPGVRSAGFVSKLPLNGGSNGSVQLADQPPRANANEGPLVEVSSVAGDYFAAMGIPLLFGRDLEAADSTTGAVGVLINKAMADEVWPGQDPLGKQFGFNAGPPWLTVVGVVGNVRQWGLEQPVLAEAYFPFGQGWNAQGYIVARSEGDPAALAPGVREAIAEIDPKQAPSSIMTMADRVERALAQRRFYTTLVGLFALAALFLASAGIYGTVSYFVSRRVRELGIRIALGAASTGIMRLVVRRGVRLAVWGVGLGLVGVAATTSVARTLVYEVGAADPVTLFAGCLILGGVAILASILPATRAVRVSPVLALRSE